MTTDRLENTLPDTDVISREGGLGSNQSAIRTLINGLNMQAGMPAYPPNIDDQGLVFFTRPDLNLTYDNIRRVRTFAKYGNFEPYSMDNAIRSMLMDSQIFDEAFVDEPGARSVLFNDLQAFNTLATNACQTLAGWLDWNMDVYTSSEGYLRNQTSWPDGTARIRNTFSLNATFYNLEASPLISMFETWLEYMEHTQTNVMSPKLSNLVQNRFDGNTRIFRFTLDRNRQYIQKSASTIAYPTALSNGAVYNLNVEAPQTQDDNIVTVPFRCMGAEYNDPITLVEFNRTVERYNPAMREMDGDGTPVRVLRMTKLDPLERVFMRNFAYPYIGEENELEWWVDNETYGRLQSLENAGLDHIPSYAMSPNGFSDFQFAT